VWYSFEVVDELNEMIEPARSAIAGAVSSQSFLKAANLS
jgi:hypothetical protein